MSGDKSSEKNPMHERERSRVGEGKVGPVSKTGCAKAGRSYSVKSYLPTKRKGYELVTWF